jgi:hypothetical protein
MITHTPGPWALCHISLCEGEKHESYGLSVQGGDDWICDLHEHTGPALVPYPNASANAALIVAAPDLLDALRDLYDLCTFGASPEAFRNGVTDSSGTIDEGDVRASSRLDAARSAIIKAGGTL